MKVLLLVLLTMNDGTLARAILAPELSYPDLASCLIAKADALKLESPPGTKVTAFCLSANSTDI